MNAIFLVFERPVGIGNDFQKVDGFLAVVPGRFRELDAAGGGKGGNLILHIGDAMVKEH